MGQINENEYMMLRDEICKRMETQNSISTFTITTVVAILGIGFSLDTIQPYLFLLPFVVLLPSSIKELNQKKAISYLVGYMVVFLESKNELAIKWESSYFLFKKQGYDRTNKHPIQKLGVSEFVILGIISYVIFLISYFSKYSMDRLSKTCIILFIIAIIFIGAISKQYNVYENSIEHYIKQWLKYAKDNQLITYDEYRKKWSAFIDNNIGNL